MTLYLILFLLIFPFFVGLLYAAIERLTARWLKSRGWKTRDIEEERIGWEPEFSYNLPPSDDWLTLWEAFRAQRRISRKSV